MTRRRAWLPVVLYVLAIFAVSSIPSLTPPGPKFVSQDKIAHFVEYLILGALMYRAAGRSTSPSPIGSFGFILAVCTSIAAADELYQYTVPGRQMSAVDWAADALGSAAGCALMVLRSLRREHRSGSAGANRPEEAGEAQRRSPA